MKARIIIEWDEETQSYSAVCPELNFISSCGDTKEEATENIREAINLMFSPLPSRYITNTDNLESVELVL